VILSMAGAMIETINAVIESAEITSDEHGCLSAWLFLEFAAGSQGFGGYVLYLPKSFKHHEFKSAAGHFIFRCMEIAGVTEWSKLAGKTLRIRREAGLIQSIGHIVKDDWFNPSEDFKNG
jgi:hypothetical protein